MATSKTESLIWKISQTLKSISIDELEERRRDLKEQINHVGPVIAIVHRLRMVEVLIEGKIHHLLPDNTLNQQQQIATEVYGSGDYSHIKSLKEAEDDVGDTLFKFVMRELSDEEDCEGMTMAIDRMNVAIYDLQVVTRALMKEDK